MFRMPRLCVNVEARQTLKVGALRKVPALAETVFARHRPRVKVSELGYVVATSGVKSAKGDQ